MRTAPWRRPWKLLLDEVAPRMTGLLGCPHLPWGLCLQVLAERPRRRRRWRLTLAPMPLKGEGV
ncbi:MAG: hypothetical protein ACREOH_09590 [Candidatus Entotheonellia bacterium]